MVELLNSKKKYALPVVSAPLIVYNINAKQIIEEATKNHKPYTDNTKYAEQLFKDRGLTCKDSYINYQSGNLNLQGKSIIDNYDHAQELFKDAGLNFNNNLINSSTGNLNMQGQTIYNNFLQTKEAFENAGITYNSNYINKSTGNLNSYGNKVLEKKVSFRGTDENYNTTNMESQDPELEADLKDLKAIDTDMSPNLEEIYESPVLDTPEEVLTSIYGEIPEDFDLDWDFWSILKSIGEEIADIGDWI